MDRPHQPLCGWCAYEEFRTLPKEDVTRVVAAVMWRHSKTNPLAAKSRCTGRETSCALPMDGEAFTRHQARAVVEEVLVPELDSFVQQTHLATQALEQIAEIQGSDSKNEAQWLSKMSPLLMPGTKLPARDGSHWWSSRLAAWAGLPGCGRYRPCRTPEIVQCVTPIAEACVDDQCEFQRWLARWSHPH